MRAKESQKRSDASRTKALRWARKVGFSEVQAPWAAVCAASLKSGRHGAPVFADDVRLNLSVQHPHLFSDPAQLRLDIEL